MHLSKYAAELLGTLVLIAVIGLAIIEPGAGPWAPLLIAAVLTVIIVAGAPISGAHYNPAVTLAVFLRGRLHAAEVAPYVLAQTAGAAAGAGLVLCVKSGGPPVELSIPRALLAEFLFSFGLCYLALSLIIPTRGTSGGWLGAAIGVAAMVAAYCVNAFYLGAISPVVALGLTILGLSAWSNLWIFLAGHLTAAPAAAVAFRVISAAAPTAPPAVTESAAEDRHEQEAISREAAV